MVRLTSSSLIAVSHQWDLLVPRVGQALRLQSYVPKTVVLLVKECGESKLTLHSYASLMPKDGSIFTKAETTKVTRQQAITHQKKLT